jgi:hypothetical protein
MKKILLVVSVLLLAAVIFGAGLAFAQYQTVFAQGTPIPYGPGMMTLAPGASAGVGGRSGYGWMHDYIEKDLAAKLDLTEEQIEEQFAAGKTMYQIALDAGIAEADIPALLTEVHKTAFDKAVADGVLTQEQADWMLQRMQSGWENGTMPCLSGYNGQGGQSTQGYGPGMMRSGRGGMGGWRWNQQTNP